MSEPYYNEERSDDIICPYCGETYTPSYDETLIGDRSVDCYTEDTHTYTCDNCGKKFKLTPYFVWKYYTETIDGEMTEEEHENLNKNSINAWLDEDVDE